MTGTLPKFSRGLKLVRIGVLVMLLQLVIAIVLALKSFGIDTSEDAREALEWTEYLFLANIAAGLAMIIGAAQSIGELKRTGVGASKLIAATIGFAITTAAVVWTYKVLSNFVDIALDLEHHEMDDLFKAAEDLKMVPYVSFIKDVGYWIGLLSVISMVRRSAIANDQLALRDLAGSMNRALLVMFGGDLFFQFTYGVGSGGGAGLLGVVGGLLVLGFWIYCHVRLQRFLYNAAYLMNEPHNLPMATVLSGGEKPAKKSAVARGTQPAAPRISQPNVAARASQPNVAASRPTQPIVQPAPVSPRPPFELPQRPSQQAAPPPPAPRPASNAEGEPAAAGEPRFLR